MKILMQLFQVFWLLLPAGFANMVPELFRKVDLLNYPVDLGHKVDSRRLFGKNKTFRGFFFGILTAIILVFIQKKLSFGIDPQTSRDFFVLDYSSINVLYLGFLLGFGALFGDLVKSFFKRRLGKTAGQSWIPFDQIDWIIGALLFLNFYVSTSWTINILSAVVFLILHFFVKWLGFLLKLSKKKY